MRSPLGTYFARPSGQDSLFNSSGSRHLWACFAGIVAESICCQMLCRHSLASLRDAVKTIFGEPTETSTKPLIRNALGTDPDAPATKARILALGYTSCQAQ